MTNWPILIVKGHIREDLIGAIGGSRSNLIKSRSAILNLYYDHRFAQRIPTNI
jgi:hypothetical protein